MTGYRLYAQILIGNTRYVIKLGIRIVQTYMQRSLAIHSNTAFICNVRADVPQKFGTLNNKSSCLKKEVIDAVQLLLSFKFVYEHSYNHADTRLLVFRMHFQVY